MLTKISKILLKKYKTSKTDPTWPKCTWKRGWQRSKKKDAKQPQGAFTTFSVSVCWISWVLLCHSVSSGSNIRGVWSVKAEKTSENILICASQALSVSKKTGDPTVTLNAAWQEPSVFSELDFIADLKISAAYLLNDMCLSLVTRQVNNRGAKLNNLWFTPAGTCKSLKEEVNLVKMFQQSFIWTNSEKLRSRRTSARI